LGLKAGYLIAELVNNPPTSPSISIPENTKPETDEKEKNITIPPKNGRIIEWRDLISKAKIFEWNEDFNNGLHYHTMLVEWDGKHHNMHHLPSTPVPEPWNSMYLGG